jgi:hypothetical protein
VNFANCVLIMTSNLGSEYLLQAAATRPASPAEAASVGQLSQDAAKELVMAQVRHLLLSPSDSCAVVVTLLLVGCLSAGGYVAKSVVPVRLFLLNWPFFAQNKGACLTVLLWILCLTDVHVLQPDCALQVKKFFRPEFLNRLDDIVVFDPLSAHQLLGVARLMADELNDRLKPKNITLKMTDNALQYAVSQVGVSCQPSAVIAAWLCVVCWLLCYLLRLVSCFVTCCLVLHLFS